jgi:hypothetical protein
MKRRIALTIALALSLISLSLMNSDSTAHAQPKQQRFRFDTGVVTLSQNQLLRVTVTGFVDGADFVLLRFRRMQYAQIACNDGVCRLGSVTDLILDPVTLMPGEGASMDIAPMAGASGVRAVVMSNSQNVRVNAFIVDEVTGQVTAVSFNPSPGATSY